MPRPVRIAYVASIVLCVVAILGFLQSPFALIGVVIYACAAVGLRRSSAWAGSGPALLHATAVPIVILALFKSRNSPEFGALLILWPILLLILSWGYFRAGQALQDRSGSGRSAIPWVAATIVFQILPGIAILWWTPFTIPTGSMEETLLIGDHIFVSSWDGTNAVRGDLVVFKYPVDPTQTFIKRIVGIPGDHIRITNKQLYVNDKATQEAYVNHKTDYVDSYRDNFPSDPNTQLERNAIDMLQNHMQDRQIVVPSRMYFVLGDNRDQSLDSRYFGFVPRDDILGKPQFIYWSVQSPVEASGARPVTTWWSAKTRWDRMFMQLRSASF